jgi:transaldolase
VLKELLALDVNLVEVVNALETEGVEKFNRAFDQLLATIDALRAQRVARTG